MDSSIRNISRFSNLEDLRVLQSRRFMDFQIQNVKKQMRIPDSVRLLNCIIWNTRYKLRKR